MGSCVPRHIMSRMLAPHCWNATSFADPEYVMDFTSPSAFCALAMTFLASSAMALPYWKARQVATTASFLNTDSPYQPEGPIERARPEYSISVLLAPGLKRWCRGRNRPVGDAFAREDGSAREESLAAGSFIAEIVDEFEHPLPEFQHRHVGRRPHLQRAPIAEDGKCAG